jgi:hypothetical protein
MGDAAVVLAAVAAEQVPQDVQRQRQWHPFLGFIASQSSYLLLVFGSQHMRAGQPSVRTEGALRAATEEGQLQVHTEHPPPPKLGCHAAGQALVDVAAALSPVRNDVFLLWGPDSHACGDMRNNNRSWPGVTCDQVAGNVVGLDLSGRNLTGTLPAALARLPALRHL